MTHHRGEESRSTSLITALTQKATLKDIEEADSQETNPDIEKGGNDQ